MQQYEGIKIGVYPDINGDTPTTGTVTSVSVNTANGFGGTVNNPTTTPAISIQTTVTGILKGNGTAVSAASGSDIISSNVLSITGGDQLKSTINGVDSNVVTLPGGGAITNSLTNNGDNTLTSSVDSIDSTADIITELGIYRTTNHFGVTANGVDSGSQPIIDTVALATAVNNITATVNGVASSPASIIATALPTKPDDNHIAIAVNGVGNTQVPIISTLSNSTALNQVSTTINGVTGTAAQIVTIVENTKSDSNHVNTKVNLVPGTDVPIVETNVLSLTGAALTSTINGVVSNSVNVQPAIPSPVANDLVAMNGSGLIIDSGVSVTTSSTSNDNTHVMTSAATQTALTNGLTSKANVASPTFTGTPTAPTAAPGTSTTQIATTAFVAASAAAGVTSFKGRIGPVLPAAADYTVADVTGAAPTASPALTGSPTAPTQTQGDNSTKLATTAYVDAGLSTKEPTITILPATKGGTGQSAYTIGDLLYASTTTALSKLAAGTSGFNLKSNGAGVAPSWAATTVSQTQTILTDDFSTIVNGVTATATLLSPTAKGGFTTPTFTNLSEYILLIAPNGNAIGSYNLQLVDANGQVLGITFDVCGCTKAGFNTSNIQVRDVVDSLGVITTANISSYVLFRGYYRTNVTNPYFLITFSMPYTLPYTNPISFNTTQFSMSFLNENINITAGIGVEIATLLNFAPADLVFKMRVSSSTVATSNPQGYLYLPAGGSNAIFQWSINPITGALTALSPTSIALSSAYKLAITQLRNYLYVVLGGSTTIAQFRISGTDGTLSALSPATVSAPNTATGVVVDPTDQFVYACGFGTGIFGQWSITKSTGQLVAIASPPTAAAGMQDLAVHPSGRWLYAVNNSTSVLYQYSINTSTGALTALATPTIATGSHPIRIVVHPSGKYVYVTNNATTTISQYSVDLVTGQLTALSSPTFTVGAAPYGLCISNNGKYIFYGCTTANTINQSTIDLTTGLISTPTTSQTLAGARDCCIDYSGGFIFVYGNTLSQVTPCPINQSTGAITLGTAVASGTNASGIGAT